MPSVSEILAGLQAISTEGFKFAVVWHLVVAIGLGAMLLGWRPGPRISGALVVVPLVSVSAFAFAFHNPFNGAVFALLAAILAFLAVRAQPDDGEGQKRWATVLGVVLVLFAWLYPHFFSGQTWIAFLAGAPMGLIPCPTLSLVIGLTLLGLAPAGRAWAAVLGLAGVFYGAFGALRLGVRVDLVLLVGAAGLLDLAIRRSRSVPVPHPSAR